MCPGAGGRKGGSFAGSDIAADENSPPACLCEYDQIHPNEFWTVSAATRIARVMFLPLNSVVSTH